MSHEAKSRQVQQNFRQLVSTRLRSVASVWIISNAVKKIHAICYARRSIQRTERANVLLRQKQKKKEEEEWNQKDQRKRAGEAEERAKAEAEEEVR